MKKILTLLVCSLIAVLFANAQIPCPWLAPNKVDIAKCENDASLSSTALIATTTEPTPAWQWYSDAALSQPITDATGSTYNPLTGTIPSTTTYYVRFSQIEQSSGVACWSPATKVLRTVYAKPWEPILFDTYILVCANWSTSNQPLVAQKNTANTTLEWYNYKTGQAVTAADGVVSGNNGSYFTPSLSVLKPNVTLQYSVKVKDAAGCYSDPVIGTFRVSKDINTTPISLTSFSPICPMLYSRLFEFYAKGTRFTWTVNDTVQGSDSLKFLFTPHQTGTYKIALSQVYDFKDTNVTYTLPCPGPGYTFVQEVTNDCTSSTDIISTINLNISPNPASQILHVNSTSEITGKGKLKLFNITGALVYEKTLPSVTDIDETILVSYFPTGIYTIVIETAKGASSELLSIQR